MIDDELTRDAAELEMLLPRLMRRLFALDPTHPVNELPVAQIKVCSILQAGLRSVSALADELGTSTSATTQIVDRLERAGIVERTADEEDRRLRMVALTPTGAELMRSRRKLRVRSATHALVHLTGEERRNLIRSLVCLLRATEARELNGRQDESTPILVGAAPHKPPLSS